jgi:hypothetical protein
VKPDELNEAMAALGKRWKLKRPLHATELGVALQMGGRDPGVQVRKWVAGLAAMPGPASIAVRAMLAGWNPPDKPRPGLMTERLYLRMRARRIKAKNARRKVRRHALADAARAVAPDVMG